MQELYVPLRILICSYALKRGVNAYQSGKHHHVCFKYSDKAGRGRGIATS